MHLSGMGRLLRILLTGLAAGPVAAFFAVLFEPFFTEAFRRLGINSAEWVQPTMTWLADLVALDRFQLASAGVVGAAIGAWLHWGATRYDRGHSAADAQAASSEPSRTNDEVEDEELDQKASLIPPDDQIYEGAHEQLMLFVVNFMSPTYWDLRSLQHALVRIASPSDVVGDLAIAGLVDNSTLRAIRDSMEELSAIGGSPSAYVDFATMIECVDTFERNYRALVDQVSKIAKDSGVIAAYTAETVKQWEGWRRHHNQMCDVFDRLKQDSRMGKLFRPTRPNRFGRLIGTHHIAIDNQFLQPETN